MSIIDQALEEYINKKAREKAKSDIEQYIKILEDIAHGRISPSTARILDFIIMLRENYEIH